nr:hypothetical protein [Entomoplasma sp. MP1]
MVIEATDLNLFSKPLREIETVPETWQKNDKFKIQITLENTFISSRTRQFNN